MENNFIHKYKESSELSPKEKYTYINSLILQNIIMKKFWRFVITK